MVLGLRSRCLYLARRTLFHQRIRRATFAARYTYATCSSVSEPTSCCSTLPSLSHDDIVHRETRNTKYLAVGCARQTAVVSFVARC